MSEIAPSSEAPRNATEDGFQTNENPREVAEASGLNFSVVPASVPPPNSLSILDEVDTLSRYILAGSLLVGLLAGTHGFLATIRLAGETGLGWIEAVAELLYKTTAIGLLGLLLAATLRFVASQRRQRSALASNVLQTLAEIEDRLGRIAGRLEQLPMSAPMAMGATGVLDLVKEQTLAEIRWLMQAGQWHESALLLDSFGLDYPDDPRLEPFRAEFGRARQAAIEDQLSQLEAARHVNDPERVLELHQVVGPLLEQEARSTLESDLARWFLTLVHRRLSNGKIQPDVVLLAGRIADAFDRTQAGASLRAALPTLRRSAGLCPRCGQPYGGLADACPGCLANRPA